MFQRRNFSRVSLAAVAAFAATLPLVPAHAQQHASDNAVTAAGDAYGLTLGLESVGLYSPGLVRGFSPQAAGNVRLDGLYFDQQGSLSNRVIEDSTIRVGITEIGYAFPAPTGIVDYDLRHPGGDQLGGTVIASVGPYEGWGVSIDGSVPVIGSELVVPMGASIGVSNTVGFGSARGYTSHDISVGAAPQWSPNSKVTVRAIVDWQQTRDAKTFPLFFTAGDFRPPLVAEKYQGQDWAQGQNTTLNLGALVDAQLFDAWTLKAGIFRSSSDNPVGFADLYTNVQPNGHGDQIMVGFPDQNTHSTSGEVRLTGTLVAGEWRHQLIFNMRGRDTTSDYGGADAVDLGPADMSAVVQAPEPQFVFGPRSTDHSTLWSAGAAYHAEWRSRAELEAGIQRETYDETVENPGAAQSKTAAQMFRLYGNAAFALDDQWTVYGGYTQGLEGSGVAPNSAANSGAVLPASKTWQADSGVRYAITPKFKIIAGVFELDKPYFNLDSGNVDRMLGAQKEKAVELSVAGEPLPNFHVNIGILDGRVNIIGHDLAAQGVGSVAVGQARITYAASGDYDLPWWPAASLDISAFHFGAAPESVDNAVYVPAQTQVSVGGRYKFTAFGLNSSVRVQVQNVFGSRWWSAAFTPGFFEWPGERGVFAYLTTDLQ